VKLKDFVVMLSENNLPTIYIFINLKRCI